MRRLLTLAAISLVCMGATIQTARAQVTPPPADLEQQIRDQVQEWTPWFWQVRETGTIPPEAADFQFSFLPYLYREWDPFGPAFAVFEEIYKDRLQLDPNVGAVYLLDDLLRDDADVLAEFKEYTLTGKLKTGTDDILAVMNHLELIAEAIANPADYPEYTGSYIEDGELVSVGLSKEAEASASGGGGQPPVPPGEIPQEIQDLRDWLEQQLRDSGLEGVPYVPDHPFFWPGFDCDDYAEAYWAWLMHHNLEQMFPGVKAEALWLYWRFTWGINKGGKHGKAGHAVIVITYNGYYYIIDPQTGQIYGPFPATVPYKDIDWLPFLDPTPDDPSDDTLPKRTPDSITPHDPRDRPWTDPDPWHKDPDIRRHLEDNTGHPADDYIWVGVVGGE